MITNLTHDRLRIVKNDQLIFSVKATSNGLNLGWMDWFSYIFSSIFRTYVAVEFHVVGDRSSRIWLNLNSLSKQALRAAGPSLDAAQKTYLEAGLTAFTQAPSQTKLIQLAQKVSRIFLINLHRSAARDGSQDEIDRLLEAVAQENDLEMARLILSERAIVSSRGIDLALSRAAQNGHLEMAQWLLSQGRVASGGGISLALVKAVENGHLEMAQWLLSEGRVAKENSIARAFVTAAKNGHLEMAQWLLSEERVVSNSTIDNALSEAASENHLEMVVWILTVVKGISQEGIDRALAGAAGAGHMDPARWMIFSGSEGRVASQNGIDRALAAAARNGHLETAQWLLSEGRAASQVGINGALAAAAGNGRLEMAQWILSEGRAASQVGIDRALAAAARNGRLEMAQWILSEGRVASQDGIDGALESAGCGCHLEMAKWILSEGRVASQNGIDRTLDAATTAGYSDVIPKDPITGYFEIVEWLLSEGGTPTQNAINQAVLSAARFGFLSIVQLLLSDGRTVTPRARGGVILAAATNGSIEIVQALLALGPMDRSWRDRCLNQIRNQQMRSLLLEAPILVAAPEAHMEMGVGMGPGDLHSFYLTLEDVIANPKIYMDRIGTYGLPHRIYLIGNPVVDMGGITKQFFTTLMLAVKSKQLVVVSEVGLPIIREDRSEENTAYLEIMGKFYSLIDEKNADRIDKFALGNLFHSKFFNLIRVVLLEGISEERKLKGIAACLKTIDPVYAPIANLIINPSEANKAAYCEAMGLDEVGEEEMNDAKQSIEVYLNAAKAFARGITPAFKTKILTIDPATLMKSVQGAPISREGLIASLVSEGDGPGLSQKIEWIKEKIGSSSEEWMNAFVKAITAQQSLGLGLVIRIRQNSRAAFEMHTCFNSLDVPPTDMTKEDFQVALDAALVGSGYNII